MEKQALQLGIDKVWLQWRGDLQDYYDGITTVYISRFTSREDPMDRDGYKEATAFPMQKPNFDVFGIPGRTRKQRGWYQVRQHPKSRPKPHIVFPAPKYLPGVSATGVDLPIELVRLVGKMMSEKLWWWDDEDKRTMMTCALVCRHWAGHFLPKIFYKLFIRSRQRAFGLWKLDRSPANCLHRVCNSKVFVEIRSLSELSFIHLLAQIQCRDIEVILQGPLPRGWKTLWSVHQALPRSLPRSFSNGITTLFLTNIHFQRFSDLTHLVCELSDLQVLACEKVTSGPLPDTIATLPRPRRMLSYLGRLETHMIDANMGMSAVVHPLAHLLTNQESPLLARVGSVLALTTLVTGVFNVLTPDARGWVSAYYGRDRVSLKWGYPGGNVLAHASAKVSRASAVGNIVDLNVTTVIVNLSLSSDDQHIRWNKFDWGKLDEQVSSLGVQLVFGCKSRDQLLEFADKVVDGLIPRSFARGAVRYAIGQGNKWYEASRDSDILEGSPERLDLLDRWST